MGNQARWACRAVGTVRGRREAEPATAGPGQERLAGTQVRPATVRNGIFTACPGRPDLPRGRAAGVPFGRESNVHPVPAIPTGRLAQPARPIPKMHHLRRFSRKRYGYYRAMRYQQPRPAEQSEKVLLSGCWGVGVPARLGQWFRPVSSAGQVAPAAYGPINDPCAGPRKTPRPENSEARRFSRRRQVMGRLQ